MGRQRKILGIIVLLLLAAFSLFFSYKMFEIMDLNDGVALTPDRIRSNLIAGGITTLIAMAYPIYHLFKRWNEPYDQND